MIEVRPFGVKCNIRCRYCYQEPQRTFDSNRLYDIEAMKGSIVAEGGPFALFGGEPLLVPHADMEQLFAWGYERFGENGIQTNGSLIDDEHIRLFRTYNVRVGISLDGPGELNDIRWAGTLERTRAATSKSQQAVERLCQEGIIPSIIVTLHKQNATPERLPTLIAWMRDLALRGVTSVRLHLLEIDGPEVREHFALTTGENVNALMAFGQLQAEIPKLDLDVFSDMRRLLLGKDGAGHATTCVWNACDPYTTAAVRGVEGNGQRSNCGRTYKDGVEFVKAATPGYERYISLFHTPQEFGGCNGCRFFIMCKGQCPGTAIASDWRNRTEHCDVWKMLFTWMEAELLAEGNVPISLVPARKDVETILLEYWSRGANTTIEGALSERNLERA
uniref:Radical SAM domain protein n=1 Tax=Solibacter usitatus (strain Ellin6076) TaxID=234267 RepID=Q023K3_SOLUE